MPLFDYDGQLTSGALFQGTVEAVEAAQAELILGQMGVRVVALRPARRTGFVAPLSLGDLTFFNEQLAAMTKAGLPLEQGLRQLASDVGSRKLKRLLLNLADDLAAGTALPEALERQKGRFPTHYAGVVEAGLRTGDLSGTLYGLTTHLRLKSGFRRVILEVLAYPLVVLLLAFGVASFLMEYVVPLLADLVNDLTDEMSSWGNRAPTVQALAFTLAGAWPVIEVVCAVLAALVVVVGLAMLLPGARTARERLLRRIPGVAQVYWSSVLARFAHTSALAAYSGTPLPELVLASGVASGSPALTGTTRRVADKLTQGAALPAAVEDERDMPALWTCAVQVAAPRGDLPNVLADLARSYELRAQQQVSLVRALLGPALFLVMAVTIGTLVASLLSVAAISINMLMSLTSY